MTLGSAIRFWLSIGCFTQEYMENITVALRFFEEYITKLCKRLYDTAHIRFRTIALLVVLYSNYAKAIPLLVLGPYMYGPSPFSCSLLLKDVLFLLIIYYPQTIQRVILQVILYSYYAEVIMLVVL